MIWDEYWRAWLALHPLHATLEGDEPRHDDRCGNPYSHRERHAVRQLRETYLRRAQAQPESPEGNLFIRYLQDETEAARSEEVLAFDNSAGHCDLIATALSVQPVRGRHNVMKALARLREVPACLSSYEKFLCRAASRYPPPTVVVRSMLRALAQLVRAPPYAAAFRNVPSLRLAAKEYFEAAVNKLRDTLRAVVLPQSRAGPGLCALQGGDVMYRAAIARHTTLASPPTVQQIHRFGRAEVARLRGALDRLPAAQTQALRGDDAVLGAYRRAVARAKQCAEMSTEFGTLRPMGNCKIAAMEGHEEAEAPTAYYLAATQERLAEFRINMRDTHLSHQVEALAYHECVPGHHFQIQLALEHGVPKYRQLLAEFSAFSEGWAMYAEQLIPPKTADGRRGVLESELFRAVRLVVDTGLHAYDWSIKGAEAYMRKHCALSATEVKSEVVRYVACPGQALAYSIGLVAFRRARSLKQSDLPAFHKRLLLRGPVPLDCVTAPLVL